MAVTGNNDRNRNRQIITPFNFSFAVIPSRCTRCFAYGGLRTAGPPVLLRGRGNCVRPPHSRNFVSAQMPTAIGLIPLPLSMVTPPRRGSEPCCYICRTPLSAIRHRSSLKLSRSSDGVSNTRLVQLAISPSQTIVAMVYVPQGLAAENVYCRQTNQAAGQGGDLRAVSLSVAAGRPSNRRQLGRGSAVSIAVLSRCVARTRV